MHPRRRQRLHRRTAPAMVRLCAGRPEAAAEIARHFDAAGDAESLHSWLRPYLALHRGTPQWLSPLLQLVWNHHAFTRGKRAGSTPLQLAGVAEALTLAEALKQLCTAQPGAAKQPDHEY